MTAKEREEILALIEKVLGEKLGTLETRIADLEARPAGVDNSEAVAVIARDLEGLRAGLGNFPTRADYENAANLIQKNSEALETLRASLARYEADAAMTGDTLTDENAAQLSADEIATLRRRVLV